jgi:hypothetical protein
MATARRRRHYPPCPLIATHEIIFGVDAEQKPPEEVATPLTAVDPTSAPGSARGRQ